MRDVEGETYSYLYNGHADVTALIASDGTIAATYYYDAFGNILETTGYVDNSILYSGYQYDEETGLYYLNARMYDPKVARFLQEDTYKGDPNDPLSLNLYTYCANNPIIYWDPTGHFYYIGNEQKSSYKEMDKEKSTNQKDKEEEPSDNNVTDIVCEFRSVNENDIFVETPEHPYIDHKLAFILGFDATAGGVIKGGLNLINRITGKPQITQDAIDYNIKYSYLVREKYTMGKGVGYGLIVTSISAGFTKKANNKGAGETGQNFGEYLAKKAPNQVTPGTRVLEGQYLDDLGRVQPWKAYYDEYGRLIGRTDYNAANKAAGIPDTHYHTYEWGPGKTPFESGSHIEGEFLP